ncbi:MAG: hypothetical protein WAX77_01945 [Methylococcaceae bacterium]
MFNCLNENFFSFPRAAWECSNTSPAVYHLSMTRRVYTAFPRQRVGTNRNRAIDMPNFCKVINFINRLTGLLWSKYNPYNLRLNKKRNIPMLINQQANAIDALLKLLSWIISIICFLIGFVQTGIGLRTFFAWQPFGFIISAFIFLALIFCYTAAVHKNRAWIILFIVFASINFVCNFNAFYPNQMADSLIRNELKEHRQNYTVLSKDIDTAFSEIQLNNRKLAVEAKLTQLEYQIRQDGLGDKSKEIIGDINKLGVKITVLKTERGNPKSWEEVADRYKYMVEQELKAQIEGNDFKSKAQLISDTQSQKDILFPEIDNQLASSEKLSLPLEQPLIELINDIVKHYQSYCITAHRLQIESTIECNESYFSENTEIGKFSHTFPSALKHLGETNTIIVIIICLLIDFIAPLMAFLYLKSHDNNSSTPLKFRLPWQPKEIERV